MQAGDGGGVVWLTSMLHEDDHREITARLAKIPRFPEIPTGIFLQLGGNKQEFLDSSNQDYWSIWGRYLNFSTLETA